MGWGGGCRSPAERHVPAASIALGLRVGSRDVGWARCVEASVKVREALFVGRKWMLQLLYM